MSQRLDAARLFALSLAATLLGFLVPLLRWNSTTGFDWDLFSGYSLVLRTILLREHRLPLHDPWVWGGLDLLSNPQTRMLSPLFLSDLLFRPHGSDLVSLIVYGFAGLLGMYALLRGRGISPITSFVGGLVFIQSSWFALHFVEGHIAYGSMQLFPWVLYFALKLEKPHAFFGLMSLLALFVLDGGIYAAIFSVLLLLAGWAVGLVDLLAPLRGGGRRFSLNLTVLLAALLLISIKVVPILLMSSEIEPQRDFTSLGVVDLARILFFPLQSHLDIATTSSVYRFHEFGCYLSLLGLGLIAFRFRTISAVRENRQFLVLLLLFFWLGSGWGGIFNPWHLYQRIPLLNVAHVQSRLFVLMHLFFVILVAKAADSLRKDRRVWVAVLSLLAVEAFAVKTYPFYYAYQFSKPVPEVAMVPRASIVGVRTWGTKPDVYFDGEHDYRYAYETAATTSNVVSEVDPRYRGMAYVLDGAGSVSLKSFTPGRIELEYSAREPLRAEVNSNYLGGWAVEAGSGQVHSDSNGLIGVDLEPGSGAIVLRYRPAYLRFVFPAFCAGLLLWLGIAIRFLILSKRR